MEAIKGNTLSGEELENIIKTTINDISNKISKSLGYYGSNTIIESEFGKYSEHTITKDGYTISDKLQYDNPISSTILDLVKKISKNLVNEVGDGSTSAINISNKLYELLIDFFKYKSVPISKKTILDILNFYSKKISEKILESAKEINYEKLKNVATVSNNNDENLGKLIADIYNEIGKEGFITLENSKTNQNDYYKIESGYEINRGFIDTEFTNDGNTQEIFKGKNASILIVDGYLTEDNLRFLTEMLGRICLKLKRELVVVAKGYDTEVYNFFKINKNQNKNLSFSVIDISTATELSKGIFLDLASYVGTKVVKPEDIEIENDFDINLFGLSEEVVIKAKNSYFINKEVVNEKMFNNRIEELETQLKNPKNDEEKNFNLNKRISKLKGKNAKIFIGGESSIERNNKKYLLEDSIYSCKSAMNYGYVIGGNLIIPFIIKENKDKFLESAINEFKKELEYYKGFYNDKGEETFKKYLEDILNIIYNSFSYSFLTVLNNFNEDEDNNIKILDYCIENKTIFNLKTLSYEKEDSCSIINSPMTDIEIMKSAISIIGLLFNSNQFVGVNERKMENFLLNNK